MKEALGAINHIMYGVERRPYSLLRIGRIIIICGWIL